MAVHLKLHELQTGKADRILRTTLDRLKSHNLVVEVQEKKEFFVQKHLPMLDSTLPSKDFYPPSSTSNLSVYCFDENLMLTLKARILMLYKFTNEKVSGIEFNSSISLKESRTSQIRPTSALILSAQALRTLYLRLITQAEESSGSIARSVRGQN
jgi:hypothetical protein